VGCLRLIADNLSKLRSLNGPTPPECKRPFTRIKEGWVSLPLKVREHDLGGIRLQTKAHPLQRLETLQAQLEIHVAEVKTAIATYRNGLQVQARPPRWISAVYF